MTTSTPFLLDERNRPFVQGDSARPVALTSEAPIIFVLLFCIPFVLAGLISVSFMGGAWLTWLSFSRDAQPATAIVTEKTTGYPSKSTIYYVAYRYSTPDGHAFTGKGQVSRKRYDSLSAGRQISVEYLANSPATSRLAGEDHLMKPLILTVFCLLWNGFIGTLVAWLARALRQARRLRAEGRLRPAEIIRYTTRRHGSKDRIVVRIVYRLVSPEGRAILGDARGIRNIYTCGPAPTCPAPAAVLYIDAKTHALL